MKNFKLNWLRGSSTLKRVGMVLVMCLITITQMWAGVNLAKNSHLDFYVDVSATNKNWTDHVALTFGNASSSIRVPGTHLLHTRLWYCYLNHNWNDLYWMAAYDADWGTSQGKGYSDYSSNIGDGYVSAQYMPASYDVNANAVTLVTVGSAASLPTISLSTVNDNRDYAYMNYTINLESYVKVGASDYSKANAKGAITAGSYRIYGGNTTVESTSASLTTSQNTTSIRCARTAETSFSVATPSAGYEFVGWYDGSGSLLSSNTSYTTYNPTTEGAYVRAYFAQTHTINISAEAHGSVSVSGDRTIGQKGLSVTATPDTHYIFDSWECTGGASVANSTSATTTITATGTGTVKAKFVPKWNIKGSKTEMGSWSTFNRLDYVSGTTFRGTIELAASTTYEFKVFDRTASGEIAPWYGYNTGGSYTTFTRAGSHTQSGLANDKNNLKITTDGAGVYTFEFNTTGNVITVYYPPIVTYHNNGAAVGHNTAPTDATYYTSGDVVTVKDNTGLMTCSTSGKVFAGWDTSSSATTVVYDPADSENNTFEITSDVDLYPVWKIGYYLIEPGTTTKDGANFTAAKDLISGSYSVNSVPYSTYHYAFDSSKKPYNVSYSSGDHIIYDTKTTDTYVSIYAVAGSSTQKLHYLIVKDGIAYSPDASDTITVGTTGKVVHLHIEHDYKSSVIICANGSSLKIANIKVVEQGDALPAPCTAGYQLSFPGRAGTAKSGSIDGITLVGNDNLTFGTGNEFHPKTTGSHYAQFTTASAIKLQVTTSDADPFYVCTDKSDPSTTGVEVGGSDATHSLNLSATGTYYITPKSSTQVDISRIAFASFVACTAPTGLSAGSITTSGATFSITDATNKNNYEIVCKTTSGAPAADATPTATGTSKSIEVNTLSAGTTYYAWVRAVETKFNKSSWTALTGNTFTTEEEGCSAPTSPSISGTTSYSAGNNISLTASATGTDGSTTYQWYKGDPEKGGESQGDASTDGATFTKNSCVTGDAGTYYCVISNGEDCDVTTYQAITVSCLTAPSAVTSLTNSAHTATSLTYTWTKASNASGYTATLYSDEDCTVSVEAKALGDVATATFTGLTPNATYYCKVQSKGNGTVYCEDGGTTSEVSGTTDAPSTPTFSPASGSTVSGSQSITITGHSGSTVYYAWATSAQSASDIYNSGSGSHGTADAGTASTTVQSGKTLYAISRLSGVNSSVSSASYTVDATAPTLSSSVPTNSATGINTSGTIVLTFSEALGSVDGTKFTLTNATKGDVAIDGSDNTKVNIAYSGASYSTTVTLATAAGAVADAVGNTSAALSSISFTTKAAPTLEPLVSGILYTAQDMASSDCGTLSGSSCYSSGFSSNDRFEVIGDASKTSGEGGTPESKTIDAVTLNKIEFTTVMWLKGAPTLSLKIPQDRALKFILPANGSLTIYYRDNNDSKQDVNLALAGEDPCWESGTKGNSYETKTGLTDGTYYIYADKGSTAIYGLQFDATYDALITSTDVTKVTGTTGSNVVAHGVEYTATFTANTGYALPSDATVTIGASSATKGTDYTWTISSGTATLTIPAAKVTGDIDITVTGVPVPLTFTGAVEDHETEWGQTGNWSPGLIPTTAHDVIIASGATLAVTENKTVHDLTVNSGATLSVTDGATLNVNSLSLKGGWTEINSETVYDMPRVYIDTESTLKKDNETINLDVVINNDNYYPIAVPFPVAVADVDYASPYLAYYSRYGFSGQYAIKSYGGQDRADNGIRHLNWKIMNDGYEYGVKTDSLIPGQGYIITALPAPGYDDGYAIIRLPMKDVDDAWTTLGEQGTVSDVTKNVIAVEAYLKKGDETGESTPNANKGWNLLGVPFMSCYQTGAGMYAGEGAATIIKGTIDYETKKWVHGEGAEDGAIRYVNVPNHDFTEYMQYNIEDDDTKLLPGWCFFVQVEASGDLTFLSAKEAADSELPYAAPKREKASMPTVKTGIILSGNEASDKTTFLVSDKYDGTEYEINADLEKMFGENGYTLATYSLMGTTRLAYNAMSNADIMNVIPIGYRAPAEGEYTFSINPRYAENFEQVNLVDYQEGTVTNLLMSNYTFTTERTQNDARFALNVVPRQETPTDIENGGLLNDENGVRKVLINNQMYIILDNEMYDVTGKRVKGTK